MQADTWLLIRGKEVLLQATNLDEIIRAAEQEAISLAVAAAVINYTPIIARLLLESTTFYRFWSILIFA